MTYTRLSIGFIVLGLVAPGATAGTPPLQTAASEEARRILQEAVEDGFAGQVLVAVDGHVLLHEGRGFADADGRVPVTAETVFAIGSVTKDFTRAAIHLLAEQQRLSLSDPISRHLDGVPADKRDITIEQVLGMRAGFGEYHDDSGDHQPMSRDEALRRILSQELRFEPGSDEAYSNSGYTLLAAIIENVSGRSYEEFVRSELIGPAGMESAGFHGDERWADERVAQGRGGRMHGDNAPHRWPAPSWVLVGAGGMVASAEDLWHWIRALHGGEVLDEDALARFAPRPDRLYAGGDDFGFLTLVMEMDRGEDVVIINTHTGYRTMDLARRLAEALRGEPVPFTPAPGRRQVERDTGGQLPDTPRGRKASALVSALQDGSPEVLEALVDEHFAPGLRDAFTREEHLRILGRLSETVRNATDLGVGPQGEWSLRIRVVDADGEVTTVDVELESSPPHGIAGISINE